MIIYVSSYLTVGKNVCVYFEKSGFCFSIVQLSSVSSRASVVEMWLNQYITKQSCQGLELKICFFWQRNFSLLLILFITESALVFLDIVSSSMHSRYFTLECCLICISPYFIFSFLTFFILNLVAKSIDLVLSSPKWILSLLSTNQSQLLSKSLFSCFSI